MAEKTMTPLSADCLNEIIPSEYLIESDGEPMESNWHVRSMTLLIDIVQNHYRGRDDFFAGGNNFIYFSPVQAKNKDFRGPDFFFVWDTSHLPDRRFWYVWEEKRTPSVVIELTSPSTRDDDYGRKKDIYEQVLKVPDYFCYDPDTLVLDGWRLHGREYMALIPNEKGWLWCEELQLWLGDWFGPVHGYEMHYPRFFDIEGNLVPSYHEEARADADEQRRLADEQRRRADEQQLLADEQRQRADAAEAEIAMLRERLRSGANGTSKPTNGAAPH